MLQHLLETAKVAHSWVSMNPDRAAKISVSSAEEALANILKQIPVEHHEWVKEKFIKLYTNSLQSLSRCASPMVTGPSNFPVGRMEKYNRWHRAKEQEFFDFCSTIVDRLTKPRKEKLNIDLEFIEVENKIEELSLLQESMKAANKIVRSKISTEEKVEELENLGLNAELIKEAITGGWWGLGFAPFTLSNNNNRIKTAKDRLITLQRRIDARHEISKEYIIDGVKVVENIPEDRLQLFFEVIPNKDIRTKLKKNGFKWSPSNGCWQTYLKTGKYKLQNMALN